MRTHRSSLSQTETRVIEELPCVDCGAVVAAHLPRALAKDKTPILCDPCLEARVAAVIAERGEDG